MAENGDTRAVLTPEAISEAEQLVSLVASSPVGDGTWQADGLSVAIDLALCLSGILTGDDSAEYYQHAVRLMIPLLGIDPERVPRVFWSQIRRLLSDELESGFDDDTIMVSATTIELLRLLDWFIEQDRSSGRRDGGALYLVGWARWRRFEAIPGDESRLELIRATEAFEALDQEWQAELPAPARDYLDHLQPQDSPSPIFAGRERAPSGQQLSAVGRAVLLARRNLARAVPEDQPRAVIDLCSSLLLRYSAVYLRDDLDEALERLSGLMGGEMADDFLADAAGTLGRGLVLRGDLDGQDADLVRAVELITSAWLKLGTGHPGAGQLMRELIIAAISHAHQTQETTAIDRALAATDWQEQERPDPGGELASLRMDLLRERFNHTGQISDLDRAIAEGGRSTSAIPRSDPAAAERWHRLAGVEHQRFGVSRDIADLHAAIRDIRVAQRHLDEPDPALEEALALWLTERYQLLGDQDDLQNAAAGLSKLIADGTPLGPNVMFNATSVCLRAGSFNEDGLRQVIDSCRVMAGAGTTPDSVDQALWLNLLSKAILALPEEAKDEQDLALGIQAAGMASRIGAGPENRAGLVYDLVLALIDRGQSGDLDEAVSQAQAALGRSPDRTQELQLLTALAAAYLKRFELTGADAEQRAGIDAFRRVATSGDGGPSARGDAAFRWAKEATKRGDYAAACDAYQTTVRLIAEQARRPARPEQRNDRLARWAESARDGAACAIRAGRLGTALALLEQGRVVNVTQSLQRQADIAAVRALRPDLADRMTLLAQGIEAFAKGDRGELPRDYMEATVPLMQAMGGFETTAFEMNHPYWFVEDPKRAEEWAREQLTELISNDTRLTLASRWDELMDELRRELPELPICVPPTVKDLVNVVSDGTAVVLNVSAIGCDALIIAGGKLSHLKLPDLTESAVREMCVRLFTPIFQLEFGDRSARARTQLRGAMSECLSWLWDAVCAPALNRLHIDGPPADGQAWPRIWWCPTGYLAALPIHAAGRFGPDGRGPCVIDRVVSSYTTTLGALAGARRAAAADPDPGRRRRLLAISVPEIPGASVLGHTELELAAVSPWVPANRPPLVGDAVTINSVTYILHEYDWLHIACHGTPPVPGKLPAQLWLSNNVLTVNRLAWETTINSELAYLSGCHTATGSFEYPDEAEHLAGAFQATGYQHVIGTLWGAADRTAASVATDFYGALAANQGPGPPYVAKALHEAVRACKRAHPRQPFLWAPFVHLGP